MPRDEYHRRETEVLFGIELLLYRWGLSEFAFDEEEEVFRNREGKVVLSRRHADRDRLLGINVGALTACPREGPRPLQ